MSTRRPAALEVRPVAPLIGAEVAGLDIAGGIGDDAIAAIEDALDEHGVLFFRDQALDAGALEAFSARFGALVRVPWVRHMDAHPNVIAVLKEADETRISVFGGEWHSDFSALPRPPGLTLLYAVEVPPRGGDTLWASTSAAYRALSPGLRARLDGLRAMHSGHVYGAASPPAGVRTSRSIGISRNVPEADVERSHPVVRVHPRSRRRALFVNPIYTTRFEDMTVEESAPLLGYLYRHTVLPQHTCRLRWRAGTLAVWDNRCTMHLAVNDYDGHRRLLYRTTVAGEVPVAAADPSGASHAA